MTTPPLTLGNIPIAAPSQMRHRINMLLWGPSGAGKTVLASTFPGKKLWIQFDPNGVASVANNTDILVMDLSGQDPNIVERFKDPNPMSIGKFLVEQKIDTIVVDSLTAFQEMAIIHGVAHASRTRQHASVTIEDPGFGGYGRRKTWTMLLVINILNAATKAGCHTCLISHEDSPTTNAQGEVLYIGMLLGSDLPDKAGLQMTEIWNIVDIGTGRRIMVRPARQRKPIKTRMFLADTPEFMWQYDQNKPDPKHTIAYWYDQWAANGFQKIPLPK